MIKKSKLISHIFAKRGILPDPGSGNNFLKMDTQPVVYFNFVLFMKGTIVILPEVQLPSILSSYRDVIIGSEAL
jgi:hypothetical protein